MECRLEDLPKLMTNEKRLQFKKDIEYIQSKIEKTGSKFTERQRKDWEDLILYRKMELTMDSLLTFTLSRKTDGVSLDDLIKKLFILISAYEKTPRQIARSIKNMSKELETNKSYFSRTLEHRDAFPVQILHNHPCSNLSVPSRSYTDTPHAELFSFLQPLPQLPLIENPPLTHINWCLPQPGDDPDDLYA